MPISATRYIKTDTIRNLGVVRDDFEIADLTRIQTESYARFLQLERGPRERAYRYPGSRERIRSFATQSALDAIRRHFLFPTIPRA